MPSVELRARILVVEDEPDIRRFLRLALASEGHEVFEAATLQRGLIEAGSRRPELAIVDLGLPDGDGVDLIRELRTWSAAPVIVLSARSGEADKIAALDAGADDYLVKPFELDELNARMRAVLRRHAGRGEPVLEHGGLRLDPATRMVTLNGTPVALSAREFAVLQALLARPGAILSRAQLEDRLYGWGEEIESNAVSVYVHQLRRKLGAEVIKNVRGVGYYVGGNA